MKTLIQKDTHTQIFTVALFTIAKIQKQPQYPSRDEWIEKMWYIYTVEYYSATKNKNEIKPFAATWMDLQIILLSEANQKEKETPYDITCMCNLKNNTDESMYKTEVYLQI